MTVPDDHPLADLAYSPRALKRAQYEALQFSLVEGDVLVRNASHAEPATHEYRVSIADDRPVACECPAGVQYETACKHRVAVAIRPAVLEAAVRVQNRIDRLSR